MTAARQQHRSTNGTGIFVIIVGAALVLLSLRYLDWYAVPHTGPDSSGNVTFASLHTSADQLGGAGVATAYFDWLAWALLIAVIAVGWSANLPWPGADALRILGFVIGFVGAIATYYALRQHFNATGSTHDVFHNSTWGVWAALAGFFVAAIGAALGPRTDED